ncbi:unnamed protein product [Closterium sp. Yama58-4]|nr:unnamed protein product [Closterium sp. Yama58-4]
MTVTEVTMTVTVTEVTLTEVTARVKALTATMWADGCRGGTHSSVRVAATRGGREGGRQGARGGNCRGSGSGRGGGKRPREGSWRRNEEVQWAERNEEVQWAERNEEVQWAERNEEVQLADGQGSEGGGGRYEDGSSDGRERMHVGARGGMAGPGVWVDGVKRHTRPAGDRCWSKWEMHMYVTRPDRQLPPSMALRRRLSEYRRMHRRCTQIHDWLAFYRSPYMGWKDGVDGLGNCKYLFFMPPAYHGMGNRIMALISAFAYALLTNRALIIPPDSFLFRFFCEPFPGSSWTIPLDAYNSKADTWGMFCEAEQQEMAMARFATLYTDYFLVPHFYLVPSLQVQLETLFPDRRVFTHLSRYLLHPANYLWDRITRLYHGHLAHHSLTVGLQIRAFEETEEDLMVNVFECATNIARVLPPVMPTDQWRHTAASVTEEALRGVRGRSIGALVVSLNPSHGAKLRDRYMLGKPLDGSTVSVFSVSGEGQEKQEDELQYELAVTEMWLLAFCDVLLVTDTSTFGYVAAGVAGVTPYTMNVAKWKHSDWRSNGRLACMLGSSEPCYVHPVQERLLCPGEPEKRPLENIPQTRACHATGVGLTTNLPPLPLPLPSQHNGWAALTQQPQPRASHGAVAAAGGSAAGMGGGSATAGWGGREGEGRGERRGGEQRAGGAAGGDSYIVDEEQV